MSPEFRLTPVLDGHPQLVSKFLLLFSRLVDYSPALAVWFAMMNLNTDQHTANLNPLAVQARRQVSIAFLRSFGLLERC